MIRRGLGKLARMGASETIWRATTAARTLADRARSRLIAPRWSRADLRASLAPTDDLTAAREALRRHRWHEAQRELSRHFATAPQRFALGPQVRRSLAERIRCDFPDAADAAARRADRIIAGHYDVLGYRGLRFDRTCPPGAASALPDWSLDPVNHRRPPHTFWSTVPFLDAACGDHKIIWELNRHQHWLALGRAFWLTGDRRYRARSLAELASWLHDNPPLIGVNWASMLEVALRSISWLWTIQLFAEEPAAASRQDSDAPWLVDLLGALDRQLTHIERNLSHYFSPNTHLLGEALALYVTGRTLPELTASPRRAARGRALLVQEIGRQIGTDGGHRERSTHYHRYALDFYALALIVARQTGDCAAAVAFADAVSRTAAAARLLADDNGRVPHVGDDDGGALMPILERDPDDMRASLAVAATLVNRPELQIGDMPEEGLWLLGAATPIRNPQSTMRHQRSGSQTVQSAALSETGYYVSRSRAGDHLLIDGGAHGYQNGGHAHADALSLTYTVRGVPLLIDPGTGCYTVDAAMRDRMRSTALHNTLMLDGRSQSLPDGAFHWSHVANGQVHRWRTQAAFDYFDGSHDGYSPIQHRRRVLAIHGDLVVVADLIEGPGAHTAAVHWHLDPRWTVDLRARGAVFTRPSDTNERVGLSVAEGTVAAFCGDERTGLGWCSPVYGRVDRTTTLRIVHEGTAPFWMMSVFDLDRDNPVAVVEWVPVWADAGALAHAAAIRVTRARSVDHVLFAEPAVAVVGHGDPGRHRGADAAARHPTDPARLWRVGDVETNARMLFCRSTADGSFARVALVDGSLARAGGRRGLDLALSRDVPAFCTDQAANAGPTNRQQRPRTTEPCAASPAS